jgi:hypothetical protein
MRYLHISEVLDKLRFRVYETDKPPVASLYPQGVVVASFNRREDAETFMRAVGAAA